MRPERLDDDACRRSAALTVAAGLQVASVSYHGDGDDHVERAANQVRAARVAAQLGAEVLILNGEKAIPGDEASQWEDLITHLRDRVMPLAADLGLKVGLEPEP